MNREKAIKELKNVLEKATAAETPDKAQQVSKAARGSIIWAELEGYSADYPSELQQLREKYTEYERYKRQHTR